MHKTIRLLPALLALAVLVGACVPAQSSPTESPEEIAAKVSTSVAQTMEAQNQIGTFVAQTVEAQNAGAGAAQPQSTATVISVPSLTPLPTATPFVVVSSSGSGGGGGSSSGAKPDPTKKPQYDCAVVSQVPGDGTAFKPGKEIDVRWIVKNTGTKTWQPDWSFSFFSGTNFAITPSYTLGKTVEPNETIALELDAIVPRDGVTYDHPNVIVMQWAIKGDGSRFCRPYVAVKVSLTGE